MVVAPSRVAVFLALCLAWFVPGGNVAWAERSRGCPVLVPKTREAPQRAITVQDIAELRDFGRADAGSDQGPAFALSPDRGDIALILRRADPSANRFCQAVVIFPKAKPDAASVIALGGEPVRLPYDLRGLLTPNGQFAVNRPRWSPDAKTIAVLASDGRTVQVLGVDLASGRKQWLTQAPDGVVDFAWKRGGTAIVYATQAGLSSQREAFDREALSGYHFDARVVPLMSARPRPPASLSILFQTIVRATGQIRSATQNERALLEADARAGSPSDALALASARREMRAWVEPVDSSRWASAMTLRARVSGRTTSCSDPHCVGGVQPPWIVGDDVAYVRREGWGGSVTALYRWRPGQTPRRLFATEDALVGCDTAGRALICGREASLQPRRLWSFDLATGRQRILFDPNPGFAGLAHARVVRLHWKGPLGAQGFGDLVFPVMDPDPAGFPTVVVQYRTRGFLRGGVGDEYPILAFASRGFAVLSVENAPEYASLARDLSVKDAAQAVRLDTLDANERRLQLGNLEQALVTAHAHVRLDEARLGITGVSDAASSAVFALVNTRRFAAASLGSPAVDASALVFGGLAVRKDFVGFGYPTSAAARADFYARIALAPNAAKIGTPMLLQYPEDEYLAGLDAFTALQDAGAPVDLYVFPSEPHLKWQAAHRLAVYRRNLAWFDFWLRGRTPIGEADEAELMRWKGLRAQFCARPPPGAPIQLCTQASTSTSSVTRR